MASGIMWGDRTSEIQAIAGDRRSSRRYAIRLETRWKLVRRRKVVDNGVGWTVDFSSGGVQFEPGSHLPVGFNVELSICWPVLLHNVAPLQLVVYGKIVRSGGNRVAIRKVQHEFRTVGVPAEHRDVLATAAHSPASFLNLGAMPGLEKIQ